MKRKTLLALGIAGAFACSAASATTYLCVQDPSDEFYMLCSEVTDMLASAPMAESVSGPTFATYYSIEPVSEQIPLAESSLQSEPTSYFYAYDSARNEILVAEHPGA